MRALLSSMLASYNEARTARSGVELCPECQQEMSQDSIYSAKVCSNCQGLWVVPCLVNLILRDSPENVDHLCRSEVTDHLTHVPGPTRRCPTCGTGMKNYLYKPNSNLYLDACPRGCGVWFDPGELALARKLVD